MTFKDSLNDVIVLHRAVGRIFGYYFVEARLKIKLYFREGGKDRILKNRNRGDHGKKNISKSVKGSGKIDERRAIVVAWRNGRERFIFFKEVVFGYKG